LFLRDFRPLVVWWGSAVEVVSAFSRLRLSGFLETEDLTRAMNRLRRLRDTWVEVHPSASVREIAEAVAARYGLRAGDCFPLAAAQAWCDHRPKGRPFVCLDERLAETAQEAGFTVVTGC
jgi:predicted nucleic acid-binding protein